MGPLFFKLHYACKFCVRSSSNLTGGRTSRLPRPFGDRWQGMITPAHGLRLIQIILPVGHACWNTRHALQRRPS